jgi:hypothetical protein
MLYYTNEIVLVVLKLILSKISNIQVLTTHKPDSTIFWRPWNWDTAGTIYPQSKPIYRKTWATGSRPNDKLEHIV